MFVLEAGKGASAKFVKRLLRTSNPANVMTRSQFEEIKTSEGLNIYGWVMIGINRVCKTNDHWNRFVFMLKFMCLTRHTCDFLSTMGISPSTRTIDSYRKRLVQEYRSELR